jgi:hypothetical protein
MKAATKIQNFIQGKASKLNADVIELEKRRA